MSAFTEAELEYLAGQPLGRIATVGSDSAPHVMPVGVFYDAEADATPRGVEIRGLAETFTVGGEGVGKRLGAPFRFDPAWIRIRPRRILAWGIDSGSFELTARDVA